MEIPPITNPPHNIMELAMSNKRLPNNIDFNRNTICIGSYNTCVTMPKPVFLVAVGLLIASAIINSK